MKIGVVGPGAMGCLLAGKIAQAGNEVLLLDHMPERVEIIKQQGSPFLRLLRTRKTL